MCVCVCVLGGGGGGGGGGVAFYCKRINSLPGLQIKLSSHKETMLNKIYFIKYFSYQC